MQRWLALVIAGVFAIPIVGQSSHSPYPDESKDAFAALRRQWARNLHDKQIDASVAEYMADAEFINPEGSRVHGTAELRHLFETVTAMFDSDIEFDSKQFELSGYLAYDSGTYQEHLTVRATGKAQRASGSYLTIYKCTKEGVCLIAEQVWTGAVTDAATASELDAHPIVALTFDDLPAAGRLPQAENRSRIAAALSAELKANHMEGTYGFVNAVKLENDPDAQQALHIWVDAGMNIGSHTWSHISLSDNSAAAFEHEIALNEPALEQYGAGRDWHWFRYPFLWEGDTLEKRHAVRSYLTEHGYRTAQVTLDFEDYAWNDAYGRCVAKQDDAAIAWLRQSYLENAADYVMLGREEERIVFGHEIPNVMLLHATAFTTLMLPELIDQLKKEGFEFSALAQVEQDPAYAQDPDAALKYGGTLPDQFMDSRKLPYPPFKPKPFDKMKTLCN
jgi:peptidoglycan/xylan/chitin deacetylase (PgdA/CDA1 family)